MNVTLQARRLNRGLTLRALADEMDVDFHALWRAEHGSRPRPEVMKRIADFYKVAVTDIWPLEDEVPA